MRQSHLFGFGVILVAIISFLIVSQPLQSRIAYAQADPFRAVYDDDERFNQLSGAARTLLERKFGKKAKPATGAPGSRIPEETKGATEASGASQPSTALANNLVNDPSADTTAQDTQSETTLVVAGSAVVSGFNDSGSHVPSTNLHFTGFSQSADGGTSWADKGALPTSTGGDAGDPVLARDNVSGTIYFATLFFSGSGVQVFRSFDSGATFTAPVNGAPGKTGLQDKEWIAVDNFAGSGQGNVYLVERDFGAGNGVYFFRSTDGGATYGPSGGALIASGTVQGAWVTVGPDHAVYALWYDQSASPAQIRVRKSTDRGVSFGSPVTVTTLLSAGVNGDLGLGGFRSNSFPQAVVNPANGNLYVVYNDLGAGGDRGNIFFRQSTDGGATWSAASQVNTDATTRAQFMPSLAVTPNGTGLAITWYDRRGDPADALIERWGVAAAVSGATISFTSNFRISNAQFPAVFGVDPVVNTTYMGDYDHMGADDAFFYTTWGDNRDQSIAVPSRKNANVRFAKIPVAGPGPIVDFASATVSGGNGNGRIDPNECNDLTVGVMNNGSAMATGVSVAISTSTPGVTIRNSPQSYSNINPGQLAQNTAPFQVSTSPNVPCPSTITFSVVATYAGGSDTSTFTLSVAGSNYLVNSSTGATIVPGTTDVGNHADDLTTIVALPFSYQLYGASFASVVVSSNGNLQFAGNSNAYANVCLPTPTFNMAVLANWDDLVTSGVGGGIFTSTSGSAPNRIFNIEWRTNYFSNAAQIANFEIRLYEGQPRFDIVYGQMDQGGSSATVGVQKDTGSSFTQFECNVPGSLTAGLQLEFTLPPCVSGSGECAGCAISCPGDITASNTTGRCDAVVNYSDPTATLECGAVTCSPASGSIFPVGTTTVTCTTTAGPSCSFRVTVLETQPPSITCPTVPNQTAKANKCVAVTYTPTVSDNCAGSIQVVCSPPSGTCFPIGATTVNCSATDVSGNTATCAFTVTVVKQKGKP